MTFLASSNLITLLIIAFSSSSSSSVFAFGAPRLNGSFLGVLHVSLPLFSISVYFSAAF